MNTSEKMPERINVMWVATYGVEEVIRQLREDNRDDGSITFTIEEIMEYVENETIDLIRNARLSDLIFQDQDGEEL